MSITSPFCVLLQQIEYQIKAEIPAHTGKAMNMFSVIVLDLELVFISEAKLL